MQTGDNYRKVETDEWARLRDGEDRLFFLSSTTYRDQCATVRPATKMRRMILWSHPDLSYILRRRGISVFIDGTFRCVPREFYQCVILVAFDDETDLYLPVVFGLLEGKTSWDYWHFLRQIFVMTETKFAPSTLVCDFESALIQAVKEQCPDANIIGCLFHFKQAMRRKLVEMRFTQEEIYAAMQPGALDSLTDTSPELLLTRIEELMILLAKGNINKWKCFFNYVKETWIKRYGPDTWNVYRLIVEQVQITNRTNNALENLNLQLNENSALGIQICSISFK